MKDPRLRHSEDSRLKGYFGKVTHPVLPYERTYCANCGKAKGWVTHESYEFIQTNNVIVICDECDALGKIQLPKVEIKEY